MYNNINCSSRPILCAGICIINNGPRGVRFLSVCVHRPHTCQESENKAFEMNHLCLLSYIYFKAGNQLGSSWVNNTAIRIEQNQHGLHDSVISINMIISILTYYIHTAKRSTNRENSEFDAHGEDHSTGNADCRLGTLRPNFRFPGQAFLPRL